MAIITISRGSKSGGRALAECLARRLQYPIVGREIIQEAALKLGVAEEDVGQGMQNTPKLWGRHSVARELYVTAVQAALARRLVGGKLIYHGLAGQMLLRGLPGVLRVRLIAPLESRICTLMETEGMERASAERYIREVDDARLRWVKMMYGQDIGNPALYDLVINLEVISLQTACILLTEAAQQPPFALTEEVLARLKDFSVACQARVALLSDARVRGFKLEVTAQDGVVEVSGSLPVLPEGQIENQITEIISTLPDVRAVRLHIQWFSP